MIRLNQLITSIFLIISVGLTQVLHAQVGIGTLNPHSSAQLDISATDAGILIPRLPLTGTNDTSTISNPATSLLIYNTASAGSGNNRVTPGYYYYDGATWSAMAGAGNDDAWSINGNANTTPSQHFVGTIDNAGLSLATNSLPRLQLAPNSFQLRAMGDGSRNAPFYSWRDDTDTGLWRRGDDDLAMSAGGIEFVRMFKNSSSRSRLVINERSANNFDVQMEGSTEANLWYLDGSENRIGIGTSTPSSRLDVVTRSGFAINASGEIKGIFARSQTANVGSSGGSFILDNDNNTNNGSVATGVMAGVLGSGIIVGAYGAVNTNNNNWGIYSPDNSVALQYFTFSDRRLKQDIKPLTKAVESIKKLNPVTYHWNNDKYPSFGTAQRKQVGFIAQELGKIFPELVNKESISLPESDSNAQGERFDAVNYDGLIPVLTKAIQEQQALIEALEKRLEKLEKKA